MCVLCYEFAGEEHWTDGVVAAAGVDPAARHRRIALLNALLAAHGLRVSSSGAGRHVALDNRKGATELIDGLGALWPAVERLSGRPIDVLDERVQQVAAHWRDGDAAA